MEIKDFQGETALVTRGSRAIWNIEPPAQDRLGVTAQAALGNKTYPSNLDWYVFKSLSRRGQQDGRVGLVAGSGIARLLTYVQVLSRRLPARSPARPRPRQTLTPTSGPGLVFGTN